MRTGVIAKKLGMTRVFADDGAHVPVTVLQLDGCQVVGQRTKERDGYVALQLGAGVKKAKNTAKAQREVFAKAEVEPKAYVTEFRVGDYALLDVGANWRVRDDVTLKLGVYNLTDKVLNVATYDFQGDGRRYWMGVSWEF